MRNVMIFMVILMAGCAQPVFDPAGTAPGLTPRFASHDPGAALDRRVIWGGEIVDARNLAHTTELVILARSLSRSQRPRAGGEPLGRFIAEYPGYLETVVFAPGREVTVLGVVDDVETRPVGESEYTYPILRTESVHLWPEQHDDGGVRFGVGIGIRG